MQMEVRLHDLPKTVLFAILSVLFLQRSAYVKIQYNTQVQDLGDHSCCGDTCNTFVQYKKEILAFITKFAIFPNDRGI